MKKYVKHMLFTSIERSNHSNWMNESTFEYFNLLSLNCVDQCGIEYPIKRLKCKTWGIKSIMNKL